MKIVNLKLPVEREQIDELTVGDIVYLTGRIFTLRDRSHRRIEDYAAKGLELPFDLRGSAAFHYGPIIKTWDFSGDTCNPCDYLTAEYLTEGYHYFYFWSEQYLYVYSASVDSYP